MIEVNGELHPPIAGIRKARTDYARDTGNLAEIICQRSDGLLVWHWPGQHANTLGSNANCRNHALLLRTPPRRQAHSLTPSPSNPSRPEPPPLPSIPNPRITHAASSYKILPVPRELCRPSRTS